MICWTWNGPDLLLVGWSWKDPNDDDDDDSRGPCGGGGEDPTMMVRWTIQYSFVVATLHSL